MPKKRYIVQAESRAGGMSVQADVRDCQSKSEAKKKFLSQCSNFYLICVTKVSTK